MNKKRLKLLRKIRKMRRSTTHIKYAIKQILRIRGEKKYHPKSLQLFKRLIIC